MCGVTAIGRVAYAVLSQNQEAYISGLTSCGVFITTQTRWLVFLSFEGYRGPLSVTFEDPPGLLELLEVGAEVDIDGGRLVFPSIDLSVETDSSIVWELPVESYSPQCVEERRRRLRHLLLSVLNARGDSGLSGLIPPLIGLLMRKVRLCDPCADLSRLERLLCALRGSDTDGAADILCALLGKGVGLTPSWDDFTVGLLLALNRWPGQVVGTASAERFNQLIVQFAYERTVPLSANLIECATLAESDERLIAAVDWVFEGRSFFSNPSAGLLSYGASSGVDTLAGIAVGVLAAMP